MNQQNKLKNCPLYCVFIFLIVTCLFLTSPMIVDAKKVDLKEGSWSFQAGNSVYDTTVGTKYIDINCGSCSGGRVHTLKKETFIELVANQEQYQKGNFVLDTSKLKIDCTMCSRKHCSLWLAENSIKQLSYRITSGANSSFITYQSILGTESDFSLTNMLKFSSSTYQGQLGTVEALFASLVPIGNLIVLLYFVLELEEMAINDRLSYESLCFTAIKVLISLLVLSNLMDWLTLGIDFCEDIFTKIGAILDSEDINLYEPADNCVFYSIQNGSDFDALGECLTSVVFCLAMAITYGYVYVLCWSRIFDIFLRLSFAPIGMADFMHGGTDSLAIRYFKKLLASILQGACIMAVIASYSLISSAVRGQGVAGPVIAVILGFAVITSCGKTNNIAQDALGV